MDHKELWKSSYSKSNTNTLIAETYIKLSVIGTMITLGLHLSISLFLFNNTNAWIALLVFILGMFLIIMLNVGLSIIAEIYRHLKEINHKTKHPDID